MQSKRAKVSKSLSHNKALHAAPNARVSLLASACAMALAGAFSPVALAQSTSYSYTFGVTAIVPPNLTPQLQSATGFVHNVNNQQYSTATGAAIVDTIDTSINITAGGGGSTPGTVTGNKYTSTASANTATNSIDAALLVNNVALDGQGIVSGQLQDGFGAGVATTSEITASSVSITHADMNASTLVLTGNTLAASTTLNQANSQISGVVAASGYSSTDAGTASLALGAAGPNTSATAASLSVNNNQTALDASSTAGSGAEVDGSSVRMTISDTTSGILSSPLTVSNNSLSASFQANQGTSQINIQAGSGAVQGSMAVVNAQSNVETVGAVGTTASVANSDVTVDIRNAGGGVGQTDLTGALVVSGNTLSATSGGNAAGARTSTGSILAGNAIILGSGADYTGNTSATNNTLTNAGGNQSATMGGDLLVVSGQNNTDTGLASSVAAGAVSVLADQVDGGSISANKNAVSTSSTGNLAGNLISATSNNFSANAAIGNVQINNNTPIDAATDGSVTVGVGLAGVTVTGTITTNQNSITAASSGNASASTLAVDATNLTMRRPFGASSTVNADLGAQGAGLVLSGASANNVQSNLDGGAITATVDAGTVAINIVDPAGPTLIPVDAAALAANNNTISGTAIGNSAGTSVLLSGTNGNAQASVGNTQVNQVAVTGTVDNSGVSITTGGVTGASALTVNDNTVAAAGTGNTASNTTSATFTSVTAGPSTFIASTNVDVNAAGTLVTSNAAFGIASGQSNTGAVDANNNVNGGAFAVIRAGDAGAPVDSSNLTVNGNTGSAAVTGNQVANTLAISADNLNTVGGAATQIAGLSNLQSNAIAATTSAIVGPAAAGGLVIGIEYQEAVTSTTATSNFSVNDNSVLAQNRGNTATNDLSVSGGVLTSAATALASGVISSAGVAGITSIQSEFALLNRQIDSSTGRTAQVQNALIGIDGLNQVDPGIDSANLSVQGNKVTADARNNNASNVAAISGFSDLATSASVLNQQVSTSPVEAIVGSELRITGDTQEVNASNLAVTGNLAQALAVGSLGESSLSVSGVTNLGGNANIAAGSSGSTFTAAGVLTTNADYGVANRQSQTGATEATADVSMRIDVNAAEVTDGTASVTGNQVKAIAQATSATNTVVLTGSNSQPVTNITGVTAAIASVQRTAGDVTATQTDNGAGATFGVIADTTNGTPVVITGNSVTASAGQNEAFNQLSVKATNLSGGGTGSGANTYNANTGAVAVSTDFSILNNQTGVSGAVSATATPVLIGTTVTNGITGGSVTVNDNSVLAKASLNNALNGLDLQSGAVLSASGAINNVQTTAAAQSGSATINGPTLGVTAGSAYTTTVVTVQGNNLTAQAGGNTASNAISATADASIAATSNAPTYQILNYQGNQAGMTTLVDGTSIGSLGGVSFAGTTSSVLGNQIVSYGYGNTASNSIGLSAMNGGLNQASASISNGQYNAGNISATVSNVTTGVGGGTSTGGSMTVSNNTTTAQTVGNIAVNRIMSK